MRNLVAPHLGSNEQRACTVRSRRRLAGQGARVSENRGKVLVSLLGAGHSRHNAPGFGNGFAPGASPGPGPGPFHGAAKASGGAHGGPDLLREPLRRGAQGPGVGAVPQHAPAHARHHVAQRRRRRRPGDRPAVAPWAPMPGASSGPLIVQVVRRTGRRAWRRPPRRRSRAAPRPRSPPPGASSIVCADRAAVRAQWRAAPRAPSGLEVSASTKTPGAGLARRVERRAAASRSRGTGETVTASENSGASLSQVGRGVGGHRGADVAALGVHQHQRAGGPGLARPPSPGRRRPREPNRSKKARLRLEDGDAVGRAPPRRCGVKRSRPATSSPRPQSASSEACGSMPTHSGPRVSMARRRRAPKGSSGGHAGPSGCRRRPRRRGWRTGSSASRAARPLWMARLQNGPW